MREKYINRNSIAILSSETKRGEFPDGFFISLNSSHVSGGSGRGTIQCNMSDINHLIDILTEFRDEVDADQAAESGDFGC